MKFAGYEHRERSCASCFRQFFALANDFPSALISLRPRDEWAAIRTFHWRRRCLELQHFRWRRNRRTRARLVGCAQEQGLVHAFSKHRMFLLRAAQGLNYTRGHLFELRRCGNLMLTNITFRNSPFWTLHPWACTGIIVSHCNIHAPLGSPNTDGFDPDSCSDVTFTHNTVRMKWDGLMQHCTLMTFCSGQQW
jgi:hypothetical protein